MCESCDGELLRCTQRGKFELGDRLEALTPSGQTFELDPVFILDADGRPIQSTPHPKMEFTIPCGKNIPPKSILRRRVQ